MFGESCNLVGGLSDYGNEKNLLCYVMWNLFTVANIKFSNDSTIASLEANQKKNIM